ncbi:MAG: DUF4093 domain-containing protein [Candidatus Enterosoma sp.]|nr:DUF4093 domain-containing protein [Candidatus Enterosoma sp.]
MEYRFKDSLFLYVVEGNDDENKLRQLGVKHIVKTNGKFIRKEVISFLKLAQEKRDLILLLDPDGPGREITKKLTSCLENYIVVKAVKSETISKNKKKVGIGNMRIDNLKNLLDVFLIKDNEINEKPSLSKEDFISLNLSLFENRKLKEMIREKYSILYSSSKMIYQSLLILKITKEEISSLIKGEKND